MRLVILAAALAAAASAAGAPSTTQDLQKAFGSAYADVKDCLINANLLLASSQAELKRLQFSYNQLGLPKLKASAAETFRIHSAGLERFRVMADAADSDSPRAKAGRELQQAQGDPEPASEPAAGTGDIVDEILKLRSGYRPEISRAAADSAAKELAKLDAAFGARPLTDDQRKVLADGKRLAGRLADARRQLSAKALPPTRHGTGAEKSSRLAGEDLSRLGEDAAALGVELRLLEIRFKLNNQYRARPDLRLQGGR